MKFGKILQKFGGGNTPVSNNNETVPRYEICVSCGQMTNVLWDMPIDCRKNYVPGCGQLCEECGNKLERETKPKSTTVDDDEIGWLMHALRNGKGE